MTLLMTGLQNSPTGEWFVRLAIVTALKHFALVCAERTVHSSAHAQVGTRMLPFLLLLIGYRGLSHTRTLAASLLVRYISFEGRNIIISTCHTLPN